MKRNKIDLEAQILAILIVQVLFCLRFGFRK